MLEALRKSTGSIGVKILFILLILSFGIWGIGDIIGSQIRHTPAITVGNITVSATAVREHFNRQVARLRQVFGPDFTVEAAKEMGIVRSTIADLSASAARDMVAQDLGITVSDNYLKAATTTHPAFAENDGSFDRQRFQRVLASYDMTEAMWFEMLKRDVIHSRLEAALTSGVTAPRSLSTALYQFENERRTATVVHIPIAQQKMSGSPTKEDLATLYETHKQAFLIPENRDIEALLVRLDSLKKIVPVSEEDLRTAYESSQDLYHTPEHRLVSHVLVENEDIARDVFQRVQGGLSLKEASAQTKAGDVIDMGEVTRGALPAEAAQAVWAQTEAGTLEPLRSSMGWHVFTVGSIVPSMVRPFDMVRDDIEARLRGTKAAEHLNALLPQIEDALASGQPYADVAQHFSIDFLKADALPADLGTQPEDKDSLPEDFAADLLKQTYILAETDDESRALPVDAGALVVKLTRISPASTPPLSDVRDRIIKLWTEEQKKEAALVTARDLVGRVTSTEDMHSFAKDIAGTQIETLSAIDRRGSTAANGGVLSQQTLDTLFTLKEVGSTAVTHNTQTIQVIRLQGIVRPDPEQDPESLKSVSRRATDSLTNDLLHEMTGVLLRRYNVDVNHTVIENAL